MTSVAAARPGLARPALEAGTVAAAMVLFALFAHRGLPWIAVSGAGLLTAAALIGYSLSDRSLSGTPQPLELLGFGGTRSRLLPITIVGVALGAMAGIQHRQQPGVLTGATSEIHLFVLLACLIGATEELVYRGWMLGRLSAFSWPAGVVITSVAHAAYKTALFAFPPGSETAAFDLTGIAVWTVVGGLVVGVLRVASRSVLPAVVAHAVFDAVVYSGYAAAPWWVWG